MGKLQTSAPESLREELQPLQEGQRLDQRTFHARYEAMPRGTKAELIGGVVSMPSPARARHGRYHRWLVAFLSAYIDATPGTDGLDNATAILGASSEPEPDACLYILNECGGQSRIDENDFLTGAPELVGEVALSSESTDLGEKRRDYESAGVKEYIIVLPRRQEVAWFVRDASGFVALEPDASGVFRSPLFAGLWLDAQAFLSGDRARVEAVLRKGLESPEHVQLVERLRR